MGWRPLINECAFHRACHAARRLVLAALLFAAATPLTDALQAAEPEMARALWTIASDDCVSVHTDGEPWDECGFQAFTMKSDGSRVLTVSARGMIQLWNENGREPRRIDWADEPSGASGYPSGRVLIAGDLGVAIVHQNQIAVIDMASGAVLSRTIADMMTLRDLRLVAPGRVFARGYTRDWTLGLREIALPTGEVRQVPKATGWTTLESLGPKVWLTGKRAPFTVHAVRPASLPTKRIWECQPVEERFCFRSDRPGRYLHMVDLAGKLGGRSVDVGRKLGEFDDAHPVVAGGRPFTVLCGPAPAYPPRKPCKIFDMGSGRPIYSFVTDNLQALGATDELGHPEIRLALSDGAGHREDRRVSARGEMRVIDAMGRANLSAPGGALIVPGELKRDQRPARQQRPEDFATSLRCPDLRQRLA